MELASVQGEQGKKLEPDIKAAGAGCLFHHYDVTCEQQVADSIEQTAVAYGGLHLIVNNSGIVHVGLCMNVKRRIGTE